MLYKTLSAPIIAQIEVTTLCNNHCRHCYNFWRKDTPGKNQSLTPSQVETIIQELIVHEVFRIVITGGEPLLNWPATILAARMAKEAGIICHLNTILTHLTLEKAQQIQDIGVDSVMVSLISYDETVHDYISQRNGSYEETTRGIKLLADLGVRVGVSMVLSQFNQEHVYPTAVLSKQLGARGFYVTKASCPVSCNATDFAHLRVSSQILKRNLEELLHIEEELGLVVDILEAYPHCFLGDLNRYKRFARRRCGGGVATCVIGADGSIRACTHDNRSYGNIFEEPFKVGWLRMTGWRDASQLPETCLKCEHLGRCSGGCRMEALSCGSIKGMDPFATCPSDVISLDTSLSFELLQEFLAKTLIFNSRTKTRREDFGAIAAAGAVSSQLAFLNEDGLNLVNYLNERDNTPFIVGELAFELGVEPERIAVFLYGLFLRDIILDNTKQTKKEKGAQNEAGLETRFCYTF